MPLYQVRPGYNHGAQRQYGPGAVVELTEDAAAGFADKLLRLPDAEVEVEVKAETEAAGSAELSLAAAGVAEPVSATKRKGKARPVP